MDFYHVPTFKNTTQGKCLLSEDFCAISGILVSGIPALFNAVWRPYQSARCGQIEDGKAPWTIADEQAAISPLQNFSRLATRKDATRCLRDDPAHET